jgi:hypothetical protein
MLTAALAHYLDDQGLGVYGKPGTDMFLESLPPDPVEAVGIYAEPGSKSDRFRRPGVQIIVRGSVEGGRARAGYARAASILDALDVLTHTTWAPFTDDEVRIAWCMARQAQPVSIGDDDNGVPRWSVRFDIELAGES